MGSKWGTILSPNLPAHPEEPPVHHDTVGLADSPQIGDTLHSIQIDRLASFSAPYPMANPPTAPTTFIHLPNPHLIVVDHPLASTTRKLTPAEEEYL